MKKISLSLILGVTLAGIGTVALASRNSSGTYSLASGNPVTSGTSISSTWANNTLGDLAQGVTDSLDRSGRGGMLAPLRTPDGSVSAPAHSFTNETGTGFYRIGASDVGLSVAGTKQCEWTSSGLTVAGSTASAGFVVSANDVSLISGVTQQILKTGAGDLNFGTGSGGALVNFYVGGSNVAAVKATGSFGFGNHALQDVGTPSLAGDAATKGYVDARFVVAGRVRGSDGAILAQTGTVTASCVRNSAGNYTVTVTGLTASALVIAVNNSYSNNFANPTSITTNQFAVATVNSAGTATDADFTFEVLKL